MLLDCIWHLIVCLSGCLTVLACAVNSVGWISFFDMTNFVCLLFCCGGCLCFVWLLSLFWFTVFFGFAVLCLFVLLMGWV